MFIAATSWSDSPKAPEPAAPSAEKGEKKIFREGVTHFQAKQYDKAIESLTQVPELGGYLSLYKHWFLGQAYLESNKLKEAETEFTKLLSGKASTELQYQATFLLGETAIRQKKFSEATVRLSKLEKKWRRSYRYPEVLYRLMLADLKLNRKASLCHRARQLYSKHPANFLVSSWGSDLSSVELEGTKLPCKASLDDFASRVRSFQWAGESDRAHREITERLGLAKEDERLTLDLLLASYLINEGSVDDALNRLIRYYPKQKSNTGYLMLLGKAAARSGEYQTSVGAYERVYSLSPRSRKGREALYQAAYLSYQFQDYDGAVRKFQKFIAANSKSGLARDAKWHLAWLQYLRSDFKGALQKFSEVMKENKARRHSSASLDERLRYWMAMSHIRLNQYDEAKNDFDAIVAKNAYSFYGLAAQARLDTIKDKVEKKDVKARPVIRALASEGTAGTREGSEATESEEDLIEPTTEEEPAVTTEEGGEWEGIQASNFKDPAIRLRIEVAQQLIQMDLTDLARWELVEVEKRTRNTQFLRQLIQAYEKIGSYNRSSSIAELNFGSERESQGMVLGRNIWTSTYPLAFRPEVKKFADRAGIGPYWIWSIIRAESFYRPDVISPVGARGLMQLMPFTARNIERLTSGKEDVEPASLIIPEVNIRLGAAYLARLKRKFKGNLALAAAAYNAGPHRVDSWLVNFGHLDTDEFAEHIPFLETRNYVKKVLRNYSFYRSLYAKDSKPLKFLPKSLGVPIPARAPTRESWESL